MLVFIASPYTHADPAVQHVRYLDAVSFLAYLVRTDIKDAFYAPIPFFHELAKKLSLPSSPDYWHIQNQHFLRRADALYVLCLDGWEESKGVQDEIFLAKSIGLSLCYWYVINGDYKPFRDKPPTAPQ